MSERLEGHSSHLQLAGHVVARSCNQDSSRLNKDGHVLVPRYWYGITGPTRVVSFNIAVFTKCIKIMSLQKRGWSMWWYIIFNVETWSCSVLDKFKISYPELNFVFYPGSTCTYRCRYLFSRPEFQKFSTKEGLRRFYSPLTHREARDLFVQTELCKTACAACQRYMWSPLPPCLPA